ncbi:MAG: GEVED domain-containing protein, partial [Saprospiraceae bacterium]
MRKTTVTAESLLPVSLPFLSGFLKKLCRSYGVTIAVASMIAYHTIHLLRHDLIMDKIKLVLRGYSFQIIKLSFLILVIGLITSNIAFGQTEEKTKEMKELDARVRSTLKENAQTIRFMENKGQIDNKEVLYYFENASGAVYIEKGRIRFVAIKDSLITEEHHENEEDETLPFPEDEQTRVITATHTFSLYLNGANLSPKIKLGDSFRENYNYYLGEDSKNWANGVKASKELTLEDLYPGIDLRLYSTSNGAMEFDWLMDPGSDFSKVKMHFSGQDDLSIDQGGNLNVGLHFTNVKFDIPESYQVTAEGKVPVKFSFNKLDQQTIQFTTTSTIDPRFPVIIDPTLTWGTFLDANNSTFDAYLYAIEVDPADGMVYCAGGTNRNFPTGVAPYDADGYLNVINGLTGAPSSPLPMVAVVYRINNTGTDLVDLTLFGPSTAVSPNEIFAQGLSLSSTQVFIGGVTNVAIPLAGTPFDNTLNVGDGFVAVFSRDLGTLNYSTYLGSTGDEVLGVTSIRAVNDNSFYAGMTVNAALPTSYISVGAADGSFGGGTDMYIGKFTSLNVLSWGTYVGAAGNDEFNDLEFYGDGRVAFAGNGTGQLTEVNSAAARSTGVDLDGILGVINNNGTAFNYLDEIGGAGADRINDVEIVGTTLFWTGSASAGFPVSASGVYDITQNGSTDVVVGKVSEAGGAGTYGATFYGTASADIGNGIRLVTETDCEGVQTVFLLVFGTVGGAGLPVLNINGESFYQGTTQGGIDMFFAGFTNSLSTLLYGTYMGGNQNDYLGETGVPKGSNHLWVNNADVYLGTTTHSAAHLPVLVAGGFDLTKTNGTNDSHIILSIEFNTIIERDYSDAPASYGAPSHILDCQDLRIGPLLDPEGGPIPTVQANGDDATGLDDEDGITTLPSFSAGGPQNISVTVSNLVNTTLNTANLYGWIDLNGDGQFSLGEFATTTLAVGFIGSKTLTWSNVTVSGLATSHYLRIRLTKNILLDNAGTAAVDERSTGSASSGEVEDYLAVELTCPAPANEIACQTQAAIDAKYATWLASVKAGGGCNGVLTTNSTGAPSSCGGTKTVIFTYTSACAPLVLTCSSTFTVAADASPVITTCAVTRNIIGCNTAAITTPAYSATTSASTEAVFEAAPNLGNTSDACGITAVTYIDVATGTCPIVVKRKWTVS